MFTKKLFRVVFIQAATLVTEECPPQQSTKSEIKCHPSELPIYTNEPKKPERKLLEPKEPGILEEAFGTVRQQFTKINTEIKAYERVGMEYLEQKLDGAHDVIKYLQEEDNTMPKAGAIAVGGLAGLIFGLRGGLFKRLLYTTVGALGMASVCYPNEASQYSKIALSETKKYTTIAYNFAYGVKKGDPPLELPTLPKLPSSLTEVWDGITNTTSKIISGDKTNENQSSVKDAES